MASHPPLGKSDHMVVSVDVKFVVQSTNEDPYHRTVYSYSKADWGVPWLDIFKHDAIYAAENKKLFCDSHNHCKRILRDARSNCAETTPCSFASQLIRSCDFWRICNSVLNRGKSTIPPLFNGPKVLTTSTDKAKLFARKFSCTIRPFMMVPNSFPILHFILNRELALRIS